MGPYQNLNQCKHNKHDLVDGLCKQDVVEESGATAMADHNLVAQCHLMSHRLDSSLCTMNVSTRH